MLIYNGVKVSNEELDQIQKNTNKLFKFYEIVPDIHVSVMSESREQIKFTLYVDYKGKRVTSTHIGDDKTSLCKICVDDVIRQIRKIKTSTEVQKKPACIFDGPDEAKPQIFPIDEYSKKLHFTQKELSAEKMSDVAAVDRMEADGLNFFVYRNDDAIKIVTRNSQKGYTAFEVFED